MRKQPFLRRIAAGLCGFLAILLGAPVARAQPTGPQQLVFSGLRASSGIGSYAQFNAVLSDPSGNLYLLLDQKDGVRLLKTDASATTILAQTQLGASGDIGLAMAIDPSGSLYVTGTSSTGDLHATPGAAIANSSSGSSNVFIGKFDQNLNEVFLSYAGSGRATVTGIAATADAVFLTGSVFGATLPVTPSAIVQAPASGSLQNGFVEKFNSSGSKLLYATYLSGQNGNTAPAAIAADTSDNAYIAGYTTSSGFPTLNALVPNILPATPNTTSGFLTKLTPSGDGILFSTFVPGAGLSSLALAPSPQDPAIQTLLASGSIATGLFPVANVPAPLTNAAYQTLLRLSLDGSTVLSSTLFAPGTQSTLTPAPNAAVWVAANLTTPASLLPLTPIATIGNSYALRITQQNTAQPQIDQALRIGGLPSTNPNYASAPANLTSLTSGPGGQLLLAGSLSPTASASLLASETYDFPLFNSPTAVLPSTISAATMPPGTCNGSLCAGSAAYLGKLNPTTAAPSLALSAGESPNLVLRNFGSLAATNLQLWAAGFLLVSDCPRTLPSGGECNLALTGSGPGSVTAQADNASTQTAALPATSSSPNPIGFSPKELDFGIVTSTSPSATRTVTVTNLSQQPQTFASILGSNQITPYTFAETSSDCPTTGLITAKTLAPGASCHIALSFTGSPASADDGSAQSNWTIGSGAVLLSAYTQAASLNISSSEIDFGTQYTNGIRLPRYLYLSNNSESAVSHTPVALSPPFALTDRCPTTLEPHTVCQLELTYNSPAAPSADSTTLTLDNGISVLIAGSTLPPSTGTGASVNPNLTLSPGSITFPNPVLVTSVSSTPQNITIGNIGAQPFPLSLSLTGDFSQSTDCPASLPGNRTCTVVVSFAPSQPGTRQGLLSVTAGIYASPAYVALTGTGTAIVSAPNSTLSFGDVLLGQPAVLWYRITSPFSSLTVSTAAPDFKAILVEDLGYGHGQPSSAAFQSTFTGTCIHCWLGVQFLPSATGPQTSTLTLQSSSSGSPSPLTLTGTGLPLTGLILTPLTQDFGSIPVHSSSASTLFTLTNQTTSTTNLSAPILTGDFSLSSAPTGGPACNGPLAPNASCFLNILFAPTATGQRTGTLTIPTSSSPVTAPLTGFGAPDTGLSLNPAALIFRNVPGPSATTQTITLANTGSATLQIATPNNATTAFASTSTCTTLAPTQTCTIVVAFHPSDALTTDTLQIPVTSSNSGLSTYTVPLSGAYTTEAAGLQILPAQANYGPNATGSLGLTRLFTINNLTSKSLLLTLSLPRQFVLSDASQSCAALAPNASCSVSVDFLPLTNGDITGTLFAQATPSDGSATLDGLAYLEGYGNGPATLAITGNIIPGQSLLNFGQVPSGQTSQQTLTLTNKSASTPLTVRRLISQWPFQITSTTCGSTIAPGQSCTATLTYTPLNQAPTSSTSAQPQQDNGTLAIESDALSGPDFLDLTGTAAPVLVAAPSNTAPLASYAVSTSSLTFPTTAVGEASASQIVTVANTGTATLHIASLQSAPDFLYQTDCGTLVPSASCRIDITFVPQPSASTSTSNRIGTLEITSDASSALDFISLFGPAAPSELVLAPLTLDFGNVPVGSTSTLPLQVTNSSSKAAIFESISTTGSYTSAGNCPTPGNALAAHTSCTLQVSFRPTQAGAAPGSVSVNTSLATFGITAALSGTGIQFSLVATPASLNFGSIPVGASSSLTLTLANTGTSPIADLALATTGDYAVTRPCASPALAPGTSCTLTVTFAPSAAGPRSGALTVNGLAAPYVIALNGTGISGGAFLLTVDGSSSATATVASENPATYNLQLTPQTGFTGTVVLNCTPITPGPYATCSLLPSSLTLNGNSQPAIATLNTVTTIVSTPSTASDRAVSTPYSLFPTPSKGQTLLCLLPTALLLFPKRRRFLPSFLSAVFLILGASFLLSLNGCGGDTINPNLRVTPPGTYQYKITATSANGSATPQTVTLNLIVTAPHPQ